MLLEDLFSFEGGSKKESNEYKGVGKNAPLLVRKAIEEFKRLPENVRSKKPLLYWLLGSGSGTPPYKMSKKDSNYVGKPVNGMKCGNCRFTFKRHLNDELICSQIRGNIELDHWCRLWVGGEDLNPKPKNV